MTTTTPPSTSPTSNPEQPEDPAATRTATNKSTAPYIPSEDLSALECQILNEYVRLRTNLDELSSKLAGLASQPSSNVADGTRMLERKTALVCTALKSSVYGIVLQQSFEGDEVSSPSQQQQQQQQNSSGFEQGGTGRG